MYENKYSNRYAECFTWNILSLRLDGTGLLRTSYFHNPENTSNPLIFFKNGCFSVSYAPLSHKFPCLHEIYDLLSLVSCYNSYTVRQGLHILYADCSSAAWQRMQNLRMFFFVQNDFRQMGTVIVQPMGYRSASWTVTGIQPLRIASRWAGCPRALCFHTACAVNAQTWLNCNTNGTYI